MEKSNNRPGFFSNLANHITFARILIVPAFILSLLYYTPQNSRLRWIAAGLFLAACFSDALDGFVARKFNQKTVLGTYIDPIADKLLLLSGFISLSFMRNLPASMKIPGWLTTLVISRDVIILIGATLIFLSAGSLKVAPLFVGKITTVLQMASLGAVLLDFPHGFAPPLFLVTAVFTAFSGILYIRMGERIFQP